MPTNVKLYRPDGGTEYHIKDAEVLTNDEHIISFEKVESDKTTTYTSNLKYLIIEAEPNEPEGD